MAGVWCVCIMGNTMLHRTLADVSRFPMLQFLSFRLPGGCSAKKPCKVEDGQKAQRWIKQLEALLSDASVGVEG